MITLYDTTLRDGAQGESVNFSIEDKLKIVHALDKLGVHFIEGGYPASNPKDQEFFKRASHLQLKNSKLTAFGSTARPGTDLSDDHSLQELCKAPTQHTTIFGKSSLLHVKKILKTTLHENLSLIEKTILHLKKYNKKVFYDAEHFFDGYYENKEYALQTLIVAQKAGAEALILCDTNGGMMPWEVVRILREVQRKIQAPLGIHAHNDAGLATAISLEALRAGATHVQGTINGLGERTGNADLLQIIANTKLKMKQNVVTMHQLRLLTSTSHIVYDILNFPPSNRKPYVGVSAFAHKAGMHIDGVLKTKGVGFEHINPESVGNTRHFLISELAGRSALLSKIKEYFPHVQLRKTSPQLNEIYQEMKKRELKGYQYETAEASFALLVQKFLHKREPLFQIKYYHVEVEEDKKDLVSKGQAVIVDQKGKEYFSKQFGNGPIDALAKAIYEACSKIFPQIKKIQLVDYKIKVFEGNAGSGAVARVWIEFSAARRRWATVAISTNTTKASVQALKDGLEYGMRYIYKK